MSAKNSSQRSTSVTVRFRSFLLNESAAPNLLPNCTDLYKILIVVDGYACQGNVRAAFVADNRTPLQPGFCETGGTYPSQLPPSAQKAILEMTEKVCSAFEHHGAFHFECLVRLKKGRGSGSGSSGGSSGDGGDGSTDSSEWEVMPIELNARIGGAECPAAVEATTSTSLVLAALSLALGSDGDYRSDAWMLAEDYTAETRAIKAAPATVRQRAPLVFPHRFPFGSLLPSVVVSVNFHARHEGILAVLAHEIPSNLRLELQAVTLQLHHSLVGCAVGPGQGSRSCLGWIACRGADEKEATSRVKRLLSCVRYRLQGGKEEVPVFQ